MRRRREIRTAPQLARRLAPLCRTLRTRTARALRVGHGGIGRDLRAALGPDCSTAAGADLIAQTIPCGLFAAACAGGNRPGPRPLTLESLAALGPVSSPWLRDVLLALQRLSAMDLRALGIHDVIELLGQADTDLDAIRDDLRGCSDEDPVMGFFERFLAAYDGKLRIARGVYSTPRPVVSYLVRQAHAVLQAEFGLPDGLASTVTWRELAARQPGFAVPAGVAADAPFVQILDPATGTGPFLVEVIEVIHETLVAAWRRAGLSEPAQQAAWNEYVPRGLLPRLHGYEVMLAPYAIAHLMIGRKLSATGYAFTGRERVRLYLTNALAPPGAPRRPRRELPALAAEAEEARRTKADVRFTVVLGNPPYSNFGRHHRDPSVRNLLADYKRGLGERKLNLDDEFIAFIRLAQHLIEQSGAGVCGMITNNAYLDAPTHRRMRESLLGTYGLVRILDLHGNQRKHDTTPDGGRDENVFDIAVGVAIAVMARLPRRTPPRGAALWGSRLSKLARLRDPRPIVFAPIAAAPPRYDLVPRDCSHRDEYVAGIPVSEILPVGISGVKTHRDALLVDFDRRRLVARFRELARNPRVAELKRRFGIEDTAYWTLARAKRHLDERTVPDTVQPYSYRPFDLRFVFYEPAIIERGDARRGVMRHMLHDNVALVCTRQTNPGPFTEVLVASTLVDKRVLASFAGEARVYPLYLHEAGERRPNLAPAFLTALAARLGRPQQAAGLPANVEAEDILGYAYAVLCSPTYRTRHAESLRLDLPRVPLPPGLPLFQALARLGRRLIALHVLDSPDLDRGRGRYRGPRRPVVERVAHEGATVWLDADRTRGFAGVPNEVFALHVGGYQVCAKWLLCRRGRTLAAADIDRYERIVAALAGTIRLTRAVDRTIDEHGGWPGAFYGSMSNPPHV